MIDAPIEECGAGPLGPLGAALDHLGVASQLVFTTAGLRMLAAAERDAPDNTQAIASAEACGKSPILALVHLA